MIQEMTLIKKNIDRNEGSDKVIEESLTFLSMKEAKALKYWHWK